MFRRRGVRRLPGGGVRVSIGADERQALRRLPDQLLEVVEGEARGPLGEAMRKRLFPPAYDDEERDREYRELVGSDLVDARVDAIATFARTLDAGHDAGGSWSVDLDADEAQAWLSVVNDLRLTLGQALGIVSEEVWEAGPDPDEPASMLLWYLGWLEEELVGALMGSLSD